MEFRLHLRHDWTHAEIRALYDQPLLDLVHQARSAHLEAFPEGEVQLASLLSVKTGGCSEDCGYCPQSAKYKTGVEAEKLMEVEDVLDRARAAKAAGASRFCMGAAWREVKNGRNFDTVLDMVRGVRDLDMEACVTLGMLSEEQAARLAEAGLNSYNHNLDTSPGFYGEVISTRSYDDRLNTLQAVRGAGIEICTGGIIGMGEAVDDRVEMLRVLATLDPHPESVPVNALVPVEGTPMADRPPVDPLEMVRMIAVARILMPKARVRLSAGRAQMTREAQVLCFMAGANSIFFGDKLLTTGNPDYSDDMGLLEELGLKPSQGGGHHHHRPVAAD